MSDETENPQLPDKGDQWVTISLDEDIKREPTPLLTENNSEESIAQFSCYSWFSQLFIYFGIGQEEEKHVSHVVTAETHSQTNETILDVDIASTRVKKKNVQFQEATGGRQIKYFNPHEPIEATVMGSGSFRRGLNYKQKVAPDKVLHLLDNEGKSLGREDKIARPSYITDELKACLFWAEADYAAAKLAVIQQRQMLLNFRNDSNKLAKRMPAMAQTSTNNPSALLSDPASSPSTSLDVSVIIEMTCQPNTPPSTKVTDILSSSPDDVATKKSTDFQLTCS